MRSSSAVGCAGLVLFIAGLASALAAQSQPLRVVDAVDYQKYAGTWYEIARRVEGQPPSVLEVRFAPAFLSWLPMVWGDYQIIELAADYSHVLVGSPSREYLWILGRTASMDKALYDSLLAKAKAQGFDTSTMVRVEHKGNTATTQTEKK